MRKNTPWGAPQHETIIGPGITSYSTASHGGYHLDGIRQAVFVSRFPQFQSWAGGAWYEEDCDWAAVAVTFPEHFGEESIRNAVQSVRTSANRGDGKFQPIVDWLDSDDPAAVSVRETY